MVCKDCYYYFLGDRFKLLLMLDYYLVSYIYCKLFSELLDFCFDKFILGLDI